MTLEAMIRSRVHQCAEEVSEQLSRSVRPIYGSEDGERVEHIGSCVLLKIGGANVAVTAAHVIDHVDQRSLHIAGPAGGGELVQIVGEIRVTKAPSTGRSDDRFDFAYWRVGGQARSSLGAVMFIDAANISENQAPIEGRRYLAIGYPVSKNQKKINRQKHSITTVMAKYTANVKEDAGLCTSLGISGAEHLILHHEKHSYDEGGKKVSSFSMKGMSGGALVDLGQFGNVEHIASQKPCQYSLAGLIIERHTSKQALLCTKLNVIRDVIESDAGAL